jgi:hypothetical protein
MDQTYTSMMSGIPAALAIWLALIGVSAAAFAVLAAIAGRTRRRGEAAPAFAIRPTAGDADGTGPAAGYVPRSEAMLRALAAAKAVTDDEPAPGAAQRSALRLVPGRPKLGRPALGGPKFARPKTARPGSTRPETRTAEVRAAEVRVPAPREPEAAITEVLEPVVAAETPETTEAPETAEAFEPPAEPKSDEQRFADELAIAAARAGVTADKRHAEWESAQRAVDAAWDAYEAAEQAAKRAIRAAAFPAPETPLTPAEYADREKYLHRAAQAAHARGELDTDQLIDALSHRNGFDPRLHPFEQDALLRRRTRDRLLRVYQEAAEAERAAWREADLARAAQRSLDREAAAAARNLAARPEPAGASRHIRVSAPVLSLR